MMFLPQHHLIEKLALIKNLPQKADVPQAEASFFRALDVAHGQQAKALELRAALSLSRLWHQHGFNHGVGHCGACHGRAPMHLDVPVGRSPEIGRIRLYTMGSSADVEEA